MENYFSQTMKLYKDLFGEINTTYWQLAGASQDDEQNFFWVDLYQSN